jgi:hypothetical protein
MRSTAILICILLIPSFCYAGPFTVGTPQSSIVLSTKATAQGNPDVTDSKSAATGSLSSASEIPSTTPGSFICWGRSNASQQFSVNDIGISVQGDAAAKAFVPTRNFTSGNADADTTFALSFSVSDLSDVVFNYDLRGWSNFQPYGYAVIVELNLTGNGVNQHFATTSVFLPEHYTGSRFEQRYVSSLPLSLSPGDYSLSITQHLNAHGHFLPADADGNVGTSFSASIQAVPEPSGVLLALVGLPAPPILNHTACELIESIN